MNDLADFDRTRKARKAATLAWVPVYLDLVEDRKDGAVDPDLAKQESDLFAAMTLANQEFNDVVEAMAGVEFTVPKTPSWL